MPINPDEFWADMAGGLRRKLGLQPPATPEEAEAQFDTAEEMPLGTNEIDRIVAHASAIGPSQLDPPDEPEWLDDVDTSSVDQDMLVLNRNVGEQDPEIEAKLCELRREALEERRARKQKEDEDGLAGGETPPAEGR